MRLALAQLNLTAGAFERNVEKVAAGRVLAPAVSQP